jgi:hypothetical protein
MRRSARNTFTLSFGKFWRAWQKSFTGDRGPKKSEFNAIGYANHRSRSHHAVIRVYDEAGNVIKTHEYKGDFKEP